MAIITRFGGSGGGTPIVDPYPHVWECTVVQSGTTGVVSGVVTLEAYDILHYTMPLGFSTYDLMIGGVTYHTSFRNEGEMYVQWTGTEFVVVSANAACALPHVWVNPTYTITGSVLEITAGVDDLHTNDVIELTLASGESASVIEYDSNTYLIDTTIDDSQTNYVMFNGTTFELLNVPSTSYPEYTKSDSFYLGNPGATFTHTFANYDASKSVVWLRGGALTNFHVSSLNVAQSGNDVVVSGTCDVYTGGSLNVYIAEYEGTVTERTYNFTPQYANQSFNCSYNEQNKELTYAIGESVSTSSYENTAVSVPRNQFGNYSMMTTNPSRAWRLFTKLLYN